MQPWHDGVSVQPRIIKGASFIYAEMEPELSAVGVQVDKVSDTLPVEVSVEPFV